MKGKLWGDQPSCRGLYICGVQTEKKRARTERKKFGRVVEAETPDVIPTSAKSHLWHISQPTPNGRPADNKNILKRNTASFLGRL